MTGYSHGQLAAGWPAPGEPWSHHCHGTLDMITDTERRALRPIGSSVHEVAVRTGVLLSELLSVPGVRLYQGLRAGPGDLPRIPHAVCAGHRVILVDSVAWPPGRYAVAPAGQIYCNGVYIGQSVRPLIAAARRLERALPPGHRVSGLVVVHRAGPGRMILPAAATAQGPAWAGAEAAAGELRAFLGGERPAASTAAIRFLEEAIADPGTG